VAGDPVYVFYHQRLRDVAEDGMTAASRRRHHAMFVNWYQQIGGDPGLLAYHSQHAGDRDAAAAYALAAADAAREQLAWGVAGDWYDKALELGAKTAREGRAEMRFLGGKLALAAEDFLVLAQNTDEDRWRVRAAESLLKLGEIDRAFDVLDGVLERRGARRARSRVMSVARAVGVATKWLVLPTKPQATDDVLASAYRVIASFLSTPHPIEALEYVLRGVALADRSGDRAGHGQGMAILAAYMAAGSLGRFGDRALARARRSSDAPYVHMVAAGAGGILCTLRGDWLGMRASHEEAERVCTRLGLERTWEASFLKSYWALGELYAGEPARAIAMLDALAESADDHFSRAMLGSYLGRALVVAGELPRARSILDDKPLPGMASIYRGIFAGELALAEHDWARARQIATTLATEARDQWLSVMPAISAMIDVVAATADLGLSQADSARAIAKRIYRHGKSSFYAATALRLWAQAERLLGNHGAARKLLDRALEVATERGGKIDQLAIAKLRGERFEPGPLAAAVEWSTACRR